MCRAARNWQRARSRCRYRTERRRAGGADLRVRRESAGGDRNAIYRLRAIDPTITPRRGERYVDDGDIITSAGISAGIDMALHVVARLTSPDRAREVREGIEYDPDPPH